MAYWDITPQDEGVAGRVEVSGTRAELHMLAKAFAEAAEHGAARREDRLGNLDLVVLRTGDAR